MLKGLRNEKPKSSTPLPRAIEMICNVQTEEIMKTNAVANFRVRDIYSYSKNIRLIIGPIMILSSKKETMKMISFMEYSREVLSPLIFSMVRNTRNGFESSPINMHIVASKPPYGFQ